MMTVSSIYDRLTPRAIKARNQKSLVADGWSSVKGGYLDPDLTADYLRRSATLALDARIKARENQPHQANIKDPAQARHLTDFFAWTAWDGRGSTWLQLFVHKQLAGRPDRGEPSNGRHGRLVGVVREEVALGVTYMDLILYSAGGVLGTMHHLYFSCPRARTWPSHRQNPRPVPPRVPPSAHMAIAPPKPTACPASRAPERAHGHRHLLLGREGHPTDVPHGRGVGIHAAWSPA